MQSSITYTDQAPDTRHQAPASSVRDFIALLKPGVMSLVVFSGAAGMLVAPGTLHPLMQVIAILCIAIGSGAGGAINMWYDRDIDRIMLRTASRPVAAGRIEPGNALAFGMALAVGSVTLMGIAVNWVAAGILGFAIFFYGVIYTVWLKRSTPQNIVIGGAAGAFPPVIGWAAVTGDVTLFPILLFLIIFLWTPPHFWALALYRNSDYARANIPMMPVTHGLRETKRQMLIYTYLLLLATFGPAIAGYSGALYLVAATLLNFRFLQLCWQVWRDETDYSPRRLFKFSILYLFLLFSALVLDKFVQANLVSL